MRAHRRFALAALAALAAMASPAFAADDEVAAVPYRPSVSTPAALSAPGWLEIEAGLTHDRSDGTRTDSVPYTAKLAFTPDWGVRVGGDAWVRQRVPGVSRTSGGGDVGVVGKRRFAVDDAQAFGLEAGVVFPTAKDGLHSGSGKTHVGLNAIYSADFGGGWHVDTNLALTRLGRADDGASRTLGLAALSLSYALTERWGAGLEWSGTRQRGGEHTSQLLAATSYAITKRFVVDAGAAKSLRSGPSQWQAFAGFTWTALQLF